MDENGERYTRLMYQIAKHRDGKLGRLKFKAKLQCSQITDWESSLQFPFNKMNEEPPPF